MKVLGVDPATLSAAVAHVENGKVIGVFHWKGVQKDSQFRRLVEWHDFVRLSCKAFDPFLVVVAESSFSRNMETVRALARSEAVAIMAAIHSAPAVVTAKDTQIRSTAWPDEKIKKDDVYEKLRGEYPELNWNRKDHGGQDQADAAAAALAGPVILERKLK